MRHINIKNLFLRNKIYYFRISFQKSDGKIGSVKKSLGTSDLNIAIQRLALVKKEYDMRVNGVELDLSKTLYINDYMEQISPNMHEQDKAIENEYKNLSDEQAITNYFKYQEIIKTCENGNSNTITERSLARKAAILESEKLFILIHCVRAKTNPDIKKRFEECDALFVPQHISWEQMVSGVQQPTIPTFNNQYVPQYFTNMPKNTIREILTESLVRNSKAIQKRFPQTLTNLLKPVNLSLDDDYSKMNDKKVVAKIVEELKSRTDLNNDSKNKTMDVLRKVIKQAHKKEPDFYMEDALLYYTERLPETPAGDKNVYGVFDDTQLAQIFDPKHDFFKKHPDEFLACLLALFSGSRTNLGITLQFGDIVEQDKIQCIWFRENHDKKNRKSKASERKLPIAQQLLDFGFVDMIKARQKKIGATNTDFIFERAAGLKGDPAKKFMAPWLRFIREKLGIVTKDGCMYTYHSFRDTVSKRTKKQLNIDDSLIDDIIGWEGKSMRDKHYLKYNTEEIKAQVDKIIYPEEILHLNYWKKVIPDLYINPEHISNKRGKYKPHIKID